MEDQIKLNEYLSKISSWCDTWQMAINPKKSICMTISHKRQPIAFDYTIRDNVLNRVTEYKYLGVIISSTLSWKSHIVEVIGKANKRLGYIRRTLKFASSETKLIAYKVLVRPILEYACELWDPHFHYLVSDLERVQRRALRFIFSRFRKQDSVMPLYNKANLPLLQVRRKQKRLNLFYSIINNQVPIDKDLYIKESTSRIIRNKHPKHVEERRFTKDCMKYSFFVQTARDWNKLPNHIACANSRK